MKTLALIPARSGSKRIPQKNIKVFCGKPIIYWSIKAALNSSLFDNIMVSTDSYEIATLAKSFGAEIPFMRSDTNSGDFASTADVITEVLEQYSMQGIEFDYLCCIYPAAPLITKELLNKGYNEIINSDYDVVFPIVKFQQSIWRSFRLSADGLVIPNFDDKIELRSQDLADSYHDAGQWYWINIPNFKLSQKIFTEKTKAIVMPPLAAQDIDNEDDWIMAEIKFKMFHANNKAK
jgi:pseudaminic acid cytidylyltransferase